MQKPLTAKYAKDSPRSLRKTKSGFGHCQSGGLCSREFDEAGFCLGNGGEDAPETAAGTAALRLCGYGWYFHRSLKKESLKKLPKSQRLPVASVQLTAWDRAPGMLLGAAVPRVP